ncbi:MULTISPECIES: hypothetical protein [unclassified Nostoc]|uniref:hypothetical protein n=1 Tax=unclassified Nostoc TaxID=2593658 RepID=UPI002AD1E870|nr:hypothetical protein [Nostoc sp. DedQUE03]MDZ7972177.1 hypothetical protein [Nostoc sp. DedQUE03]MDZ8047168.1 hypothetical protein [Nostoc sp. DedQUE02]
MVQIADECEKYGFEILNDGIYDHDQKLGEVGCTNNRWWVIRATSVYQQKIPCDSAFDAVWVLSMVELTQPSREELLGKPFDRLTANDFSALVRNPGKVAELQEKFGECAIAESTNGTMQTLRLTFAGHQEVQHFARR